ncbi:arsenical pump membrane protein [Thermococcus onnurineus NA1]|uniref:Arsenical pump membrane protein n=1 Tax=Thermococcus onnurineus (strain NA1) TaxID=523850 RepID=B6YXY5_THEON|nr:MULTISPECIES: ArsB/NhaD family transporter [Thermococcus]ACJ16948.1 arsenical pump membrane protein [Thermococcus onnurineus NA1]NJE46716.1 transporter [Thermococcus sp. GR7]NJE77856.1 transporter [Thermococcus sp. GR4]NJF22984.1 transporter [Thermococcus sp. GR5]
MEQVIIAVAVFLFTYALIISERVHRTVAALFGASIVLFLGIVPWEMLPEYLDLGTLLLLIGMMIIVNTAKASGLFEFIAIKTAKFAKGSPMKVLIMFSFVTALVSSVLDNVTTVLLLTPMLLYITRLMDVNPIPFLLAEIFASNIGGTATLIGDPPNIMIGSAAGLSFTEFLLNMGPIAAIDLAIALGIIYLAYRNEMKTSKAKRERILSTIERLREDEAIRDYTLFKKSVTVIIGVVLLFFVHDRLEIPPAVVALTGASVLLMWSRMEPTEILEKIEWTAIFFFMGLFIIVGSLVETGVIDDVAQWLLGYVHTTGQALVMVTWFSAIASAIVDNIPLTAAMIPLIKSMGTSMDVYPLWWALSLGACLGGNGTAIGASANIVVLGIASREGVKITFMDFLKIGLVIMFTTVAAGMGLLWIRYIGV